MSKLILNAGFTSLSSRTNMFLCITWLYVIHGITLNMKVFCTTVYCPAPVLLLDQLKAWKDVT